MAAKLKLSGKFDMLEVPVIGKTLCIVLIGDKDLNEEIIKAFGLSKMHPNKPSLQITVEEV